MSKEILSLTGEVVRSGNFSDVRMAALSALKSADVFFEQVDKQIKDQNEKL